MNVDIDRLLISNERKSKTMEEWRIIKMQLQFAMENQLFRLVWPKKKERNYGIILFQFIILEIQFNLKWMINRINFVDAVIGYLLDEL